jgi:phosphoribosylglycinamide formyltransferase-1
MAFRAVVHAQREGLLSSATQLLLLDRESDVEQFAADHNVACINLQSEIERGSQAFQSRVSGLVRQHEIEWLGLSFNRLLSSEVIDALDGHIFNLHLSLLPAFPGFGSVRKALLAGVRMAGVTVHLVDSGMDTGPVLAQATCAVGTRDNVGSLGRRLFEAGLPLILQVVRSIERGELTLDPDRKPVWPRAERPNQDGSAFPQVDADLVLYSREFCGKLSPLAE